MGDVYKEGVCNASALGAFNGNDCCFAIRKPLGVQILTSSAFSIS